MAGMNVPIEVLVTTKMLKPTETMYREDFPACIIKNFSKPAKVYPFINIINALKNINIKTKTNVSGRTKEGSIADRV